MESGDKRAQWARVAARIREDIIEGRLPLGEHVGGEYELADRFGVSRGTVVRALQQLRYEGLVQTRHGQGSFVATVPPQSTVTLGSGDRATVRLPLDDDERARLAMPPGVPVIVIRRAAGGEPELHDGSVTVIRCEGFLMPGTG